MLIRAVSKYLEAHKRLVVPQLGAFLVKEPGVSVVFSELMKRDDGVLRGLLREAGVGDLEAAGMIDRFVFEVRHAVERGENYPLEGFGVLHPGPNGTIAFEYRPAPVGSADAAPAAAAAPAAGPAEPAAEAPVRGAKRSSIDSDRMAEAVRSAFSDAPGHVSTSAKMNPEPYVRGLRYGKPAKTTDAYRYVDRAPRRRGLDRFLLLGILVAVIAIAAIAYGWWCDRRAEALETEPIVLPMSDGAESGFSSEQLE
ncbi:MAG: hypothetical protein K2I59_04440 [Alistipes sp.]|nr:hypothetical protein [Alistipes sp.]